MLEVVRDRMESLHAVQHYIAEGLKDIRENLPVQRRPAQQADHGSPRVGDVGAIAMGRLSGAEFDHRYSRHRNGPRESSLVCDTCNQRLLDTEFKTEARSAFESYQAALRPLLSRQVPLALADAPKGE